MAAPNTKMTAVISDRHDHEHRPTRNVAAAHNNRWATASFSTGLARSSRSRTRSVVRGASRSSRMASSLDVRPITPGARVDSISATTTANPMSATRQTGARHRAKGRPPGPHGVISELGVDGSRADDMVQRACPFRTAVCRHPMARDGKVFVRSRSGIARRAGGMTVQVGLLGRGREIDEVVRRVGERRLVTLIGPGGIGKTALAHHVVAGLGASVVIDLTSISSDSAVGGAFAAQLGQPSLEALLASPARANPILVDNCEHVLSGSARAVEQLLDADPGWKVLATSRSPLGTVGESVVALGPLATEPAVALFLARARDCGVDIDRSDVATLTFVEDLCLHLECVPLAIEIAAARARVMSPATVLGHLRDGMDVLQRPHHRGPDRHRSVRDTISWSYELLDEPERVALDRLSVCGCRFDVDTAASVIDPGPASGVDARSATLALIDSLIGASLITVDVTSRRAPYRLLGTVRAFARDRLDLSGGRSDAEDRYVDHVLTSVVDIIESARSGWTAEVLNSLLDRYDSIAEALSSCLARDDEPARSLLLCSVLWGVVHNGHVDDVAELGRRTLQRWQDPSQPFWAETSATLATATLMLGHIDQAVAQAEAALSNVGSAPFAPAMLRRVLGLAAQSAGDHPTAAELFTETAEAARASGAGAIAMEADVLRAQALSRSGRYEEALPIVRRSRGEAVAGSWQINSAFAALVEGAMLIPVDHNSAWSCLTEALETSRAADYPYGVTASLQAMAYALLRQGRDDEAAATIAQLIDELGTSTTDWSRGDPLGPVAALMFRRGESGWEDVAATAEARSVTSPLTAVGLHLVDLPSTSGRALTSREANEALLAFVANPASTPITGPSEPEGMMALEGEVWTLTFGGVTAHVRRSKGLADLARLLDRPGVELSCLDLAGSAVQERSTADVIDEVARRDYERRIRELQAEIDDAHADGDIGRAERSRVEFDVLVDHLSSATGLGGRTRRHADTTERARSAVTHRIRSTIKRVEAVHPELGAHLRAAVHTGTFVKYAPEDPVRWTVRLTA